MRRRGGGHDGGGGGGHDGSGSMRWLLTYADLITLLMVFFVVLYAMSKRDQAKYTALAASLTRTFAGFSFGYGHGGGGVIRTPLNVGGTPGLLPAEATLTQVGHTLGGVVRAEGFGQAVQLTLSSSGLLISFRQEAAFFQPASAALEPPFQHLLLRFAPVLARLPNEIYVEGFTDNQPLHSAEFTTSWELSSRRATNVVRFLTEKAGLDPHRFAAVAFGEYRPKYPNDNAADRRMNRRVDLIVLRHPPTPPWGTPESSITP